MEQTKKRSAVSWVIEFAGQKKPNYILSVILAMCKVVFGLMPYLYMADIVGKLIFFPPLFGTALYPLYYRIQHQF